MVAADEAYRIGLVDRVVAADALVPEAHRVAADLAAKPPVALRQAKRTTAMAAEALLAAGCRLEIEAFGLTFGTEDRVEGLKAFLAKRPPAWKGR
jgi:enoyl-CoA hydratase/carnithine racemase